MLNDLSSCDEVTWDRLIEVMGEDNLEAHLKGVMIEQIESSVQDFFEQTQVNLMSVTAEHFAAVIQLALDHIQCPETTGIRPG